ncbi:hypothetical protein N8482_03115 [Chitinophagales bacterium]|nr:hypothetical protein [Chitinophagales bacterium]
MKTNSRKGMAIREKSLVVKVIGLPFLYFLIIATFQISNLSHG